MTTLRAAVPDDLHEAVLAQAEREHISVDVLISRTLRARRPLVPKLLSLSRFGNDRNWRPTFAADGKRLYSCHMKTHDLLPIRTVLRVVTLGLILADGPAFAQTAAPTVAATAITKVPYVITKPGHYLIKKNLFFDASTGNAITISASDVTLDFGGHFISSNAPKNDTNSNVGVGLSSAHTAQDITIRNGVLRNFDQGILLDTNNSPGRVLIEDMGISNSGTSGIQVNARSTEIRHCQIVDTGYNFAIHEIFGIKANGIASAWIVDNDIAGLADSPNFGSTGILTSFSIVERNRLRRLTGGGTVVGISCPNSVAIENTVSFFSAGISFGVSAGKYRGNITVGCTTPFDGGTAVGTEND